MTKLSCVLSYWFFKLTGELVKENSIQVSIHHRNIPPGRVKQKKHIIEDCCNKWLTVNRGTHNWSKGRESVYVECSAVNENVITPLQPRLRNHKGRGDRTIIRDTGQGRLLWQWSSGVIGPLHSWISGGCCCLHNTKPVTVPAWRG